MRKYFIYSLDNGKDFVSNKWSILIKFLSLVLIVPVLIILLTKYTLSDTSDDYKLEKMSSGVLLQYIGIPIVLFIIQSLFKIPVGEAISKYKNLAGLLYLILPVISSLLIVYVFQYKGSSYLDKSTSDEKEMESLMSESAVEQVCDESQNKYKYAVGFVTIVFCILCFGPLSYAGIFQPLNGILLLTILVIILKVVYSIQDNKSEYNILNPMRENKEGKIDLDTTTSIATVLGSISVGTISLLLFRNIK